MEPRDWIGFAADVIAIGTLLFTLVVFWRAKRKLALALKTIQARGEEAPVALSIGLGQNIRSVVELHLKERGLSMPVYNYCKTGVVPSSQFHSVLRDILEIKQRITDAGAKEVHLFYMGPVTLSVGLGAVLDNWVPVIVYKYANGQYESEFVLQKETVLGLLDQAVDSGIEMIT
jgi:hypothetical protein